MLIMTLNLCSFNARLTAFGLSLKLKATLLMTVFYYTVYPKCSHIVLIKWNVEIDDHSF